MDHSEVFGVLLGLRRPAAPAAPRLDLFTRRHRVVGVTGLGDGGRHHINRQGSVKSGWEAVTSRSCRRSPDTLFFHIIEPTKFVAMFFVV